MSDPGQDYLHPQSPVSPVQQQPTWPRNNHKPGVKYTKRFDSGLGDIDSEDGEVSLRPMAAQRVPYGRVSEYDYAARGSHLYEDLPIKYVPASEESLTREKSPPEPHQESSWPSTVSTTNSQANIVNNNTEARKRHNPLYDAIQTKYPNPAAPAPEGESVHKLSQQKVMFICIFAVIALIISVVALCLTIYMLATLPPDKYAEENKVHFARYTQLKADYKDLSEKYAELASMLSYSPDDGNSSDISLATKVARNKLSIQKIEENVTIQQKAVDSLKTQVMVIDDMQNKLVVHNGNISKNSESIHITATDVNSLTDQVAVLRELVMNVSKMEGPQGPQGVGNLSACFHIIQKQTLRNAIPDATKTNWNPSPAILKDSVVMSAACSVIGGEVASLESRPEDSVPNGQQYRCHCSGVDSKIPDRVCSLHMWMCPRLS